MLHSKAMKEKTRVALFMGLLALVSGNKYHVHHLTKENFEQRVAEKPHFVLFSSDRYYLILEL